VKIFIWIMVSLAVVIGLVTLVGMRVSKSLNPEAVATSVRVESLKRGDLTEFVSAPGQVQPRTKVSISARVAARINELPFDEGQTVQKDKSVLVKLDATDLEAQLKATVAQAAAQMASLDEAHARIAATVAQIAASQVMFEDAKRDLNRQKKLLGPGDVSQSAVDQAQAKADQLEKQIESSQMAMEADKQNLLVLGHQIEAAQADIARARDNLSYTTIVSPIDGIVTRVNAKVGEVVVTGTMNNPGTVILEVADLSEMQVDAQVDESNIASVREGQRAKLRISAYPDEIWDGKVKLVGLDVVDPRMSGGGMGNSPAAQGRWYRARIVVDTKGKRIPAGLSADADIETKVHKNVLKVPTQAVMGRPMDELPAAVKTRAEVDKNKTLATVVFKVEGGKAVITPVTIGASDMTHTVIESGLKESDQIIVGPYKILPTMKDATAVTYEGATTAPSSASITTMPATAPATVPTTQSH
jgi:HlyD family secretion protein